MQGGAPLIMAARVKSPVMVGAERVIGVALGVRLVRVNRIGALVLWSGMVPKSWLAGLRVRPCNERPTPVRARV